MRRFPKTMALLTAAALAGAATNARAETAVPVGTVTAITVDGDLADWKDVPVRYLDGGPRITAVARDDRFLYVNFRFADLEMARRVLRGGAIVWFGAAGAHRTDLGLRYRGTEAARQALREMEGEPGEVSPGVPGGGPPPGGPDGGSARPARAPLGALEVLRDGVVDEVLATGRAPDGPAAACRVTDGSFVYELRMPLAELLPAAGAGKPGSAARLAVGFQMSGMLKAERDAMRGPGGPPGGGMGGPGGGMGGRGGGMGGPGGSMGGPGGGMRGGEPVWLDVELAGKAGPAPATR
jgi:hypothetical protein